MATFLNTPKLNYWIPKLIKESKKELILIVPYIQISENIFNSLKKADSNNVEITLIYRENKLSTKEKQKLSSLKNLNLLHHPNIHCKSYFNGNLLIVGSMNLYEYSEINNREMGVLFHYKDEDDNGESYFGDEDDVFNDAKDEIREIVNSSKLEILCKKSKNSSFDINIIKTEEELEVERCIKLNQYFLNKRFKPTEIKENWVSICESYFDKIDVILDYHRIEIHFNLNEEELKELHYQWKKTYSQYEFKGFKYYWNNTFQPIYLYQNLKSEWENLDDSQGFEKINQGLEKIIEKYRMITGK